MLQFYLYKLYKEISFMKSSKISELRSRDGKSRATKLKKSKKMNKFTAKKGRPKKKKVSQKNDDLNSEGDLDFCMICLQLMPKRLNRNNSTQCKSCHRPFYLKCVSFSGSSFSCFNCNAKE